MTIRLTAYETLVGEGQQIGKIQAAIAGVPLGNGVESINTDTYRVIGGDPQAQMIPAFSHPMLCANSHTHGNKKIAVDVRSYGTWDMYQRTFKVRVRTSYDFDILRAQLNTIWVNEAPMTLARLSSLPMNLFAGWISENITQKYLLNQREQDSLRVWAGAFYYSSFMDQEDFHSATRTQMTMALQQGLNMPPTIIIPVLDKLERPISGLVEFCEMFETITDNIRFKGYNAGILIAQLRGTWFSGSNTELIAVALEHPPTWISMVYAAATDRSYHNTDLHRRLERIDRQHKNAQLFVRAIASLVQSYQ